MAIKTYPKTSKQKLSENFAVSEFACHGQGCCSTVMVDDDLVNYLQKIRDHFKTSVTVSSGYRCPVHNKNVGGATGSRHAKGMAADIVLKGVTPAEVAKYAETIGIKGIGLYETNRDGHFVHIDTRTTKSFWYGQGQAYRSTFGGSAADNSDYTKEKFIREVQESIGAKVDGIAGSETLSKTPTVSSRTNRTHSVIKCIQKYLRALGYSEVGVPDGIPGGKFTSAVAHFQVDNNLTGDGVVGPITWKALFETK